MQKTSEVRRSFYVICNDCAPWKVFEKRNNRVRDFFGAAEPT